MISKVGRCPPHMHTKKGKKGWGERNGKKGRGRAWREGERKEGREAIPLPKSQCITKNKQNAQLDTALCSYPSPKTRTSWRRAYCSQGKGSAGAFETGEQWYFPEDQGQE